jgi:hypothetical protein
MQQQQGFAMPTELQWHSVIDWVNSFNDSHCLLVSAFADLVDGVALCHLVGMIVCSPEDQLQMKLLINYDSNGDKELQY